MKNLLILTDAFPPTFAPRIEAVAKYLPSFGWNPVVVTISTEESSYTHTATDSQFDQSCVVYRYSPKSASEGSLNHVFSFFQELIFESRDKSFEQYIETLSLPRFDAILCFAYRKFPFRTAGILARKMNIPWVADCRDIVEQYTSGDFLPKKLKVGPVRLRLLPALIKRQIVRCRNAAIKTASCVTTVSPWHKDILSRVNRKVEIIYNGFDPEIFVVRHFPHDRFRIVYTGRILSLEMRDPTLLLEALSSAELRSIINEGLVDLIWYVDPYSQEMLMPLIRSYGLEKINKFERMVPRKEMARIISSADILLQLSNKETTKGPHGMVSTKIFEALAVEKPVLLVRSDETVMEHIIESHGLGCAGHNKSEVVRFIKERYDEWKANGYTKVEIPQGDKMKFSRKNQTGQFAAVLDNLI